MSELEVQSAESFFNKETEETKQKREASASSASSEGQVKTEKVKVSGTYLMDVACYAYEKDGKVLTSPRYDIASTGSLMALLTLNVVDGTPQVPKGSSLYTNIVLMPDETASQKTLDNIMGMAKPKLKALTGEEFKPTAAWFDEYMIPKFEKKEGGGFEMTKDHKMKQQVKVVVEDAIYNNQEVLNVSSITIPEEGFKSISNKVEATPDTTQNMAASSPEEFENIDISNAAGDQPAATPQPQSDEGLPSDF